MLEWGVKTPGGRALHLVHWSWQGLVRRGGGGDIYYYKLLKQSRDVLEMSLWSRLGSGNQNVSCLCEIRNERSRVTTWTYDFNCLGEMKIVGGHLSAISLATWIEQNQVEIESKTRKDVRKEPDGEGLRGATGCLWLSLEGRGSTPDLGANSWWGCSQRVNMQHRLSRLCKQLRWVCSWPQGHQSRCIVTGPSAAPIRTRAQHVRIIGPLDALLMYGETARQGISTDDLRRLMWWLILGETKEVSKIIQKQILLKKIIHSLIAPPPLSYSVS